MSAVAGHALSLRGLTKRYGPVVAIDGVSLDVAPGEFLTLLGPSGSGKSTILMTIAGFVEPTAGEVLLDGEPVTRLPPEARNFGVVFQGYALFPHMTVRENILYPLQVRGLSGAEQTRRLSNILELVQLGALAERLPRNLSGGQQQRVALARALVFEPALLLLDEPLSALDKKLRADLQVELKALHRRLGTTFVNVTHDQEEAMTMSDRIVILDHGKLIQIGAASELYDRPQTRFVAEFLGRSNFLEAVVEGVDGSVATLAVAGQRLRHRLTEPATAGQALLILLRPERIALDRSGGDGAAAAGDENVASGVVIDAAFVGDRHQYLVDSSVGRLSISTPAFSGAGLMPPGAEVTAVWSIGAATAVAP